MIISDHLKLKNIANRKRKIKQKSASQKSLTDWFTVFHSDQRDFKLSKVTLGYLAYSVTD
ncbi:hypothetical protein GCM10007894_01940 [Paraferrimonas haliotis]|uniref:Uncharacterized protein n=1 Tax=Paraferrimonas haliotis TaxID=2013866 RepID=A0AA37WVL2_9GAMM|nr:hypothetical protein GCM10007894_01940 [Paraferrimonas haliotis]